MKQLDKMVTKRKLFKVQFLSYLSPGGKLVNSRLHYRTPAIYQTLCEMFSPIFKINMQNDWHCLSFVAKEVEA